MTTLHGLVAALDAVAAALEVRPPPTADVEVYRDNEGDVLIEREC